MFPWESHVHEVAEGKVLSIDLELSFWGGVDPTTG
jgi:predicted aconitase with swiveling domain